MKLFALLFVVASASAGRLENTYLPPSSAISAGGSGRILATPFNLVPSSRLGSSVAARLPTVALTPTPVYGVPVVAAPSAYSGPVTPPVPILRLDNENNGDGSYRYEYETANHIAAQEAGRLVAPDSSQVHGSYSYLAPDGQTITVNYVADENGFQPQGDHLPTPPPIPEAILKSLQINAAEEARGAVDNGQYRSSSSGLGVAQQYSAPVVSNVNAQYLPPSRQQQGGYRY